MDYSQLHDAQINMMVCKALGLELSSYARIIMQDDATILLSDNKTLVDYCNNPADAWPIIDENNITIINDSPSNRCAVSNVAAFFNGERDVCKKMHSNPLRAAMIVFLMMRDEK